MRIFLLLSLFLFYTPPAQAVAICSCNSPTFEKSVKHSRAIFTGTVKRIRSRGSEVLVRMELHDLWKGNLDTEVTVRTERDDLYGLLTYGVSCDAYPFEEGKEYLVFTYRYKSGRHHQRVSRCGLTREIKAAKPLINALGKPLKTYRK
jgi:hypothetical protein